MKAYKITIPALLITLNGIPQARAGYVMQNDFKCEVLETNWNGIGHAIISNQTVEINQPGTKYAVDLGFSGMRMEFVENHTDGRYSLSLATSNLPSQIAEVDKATDKTKEFTSRNNKMSVLAPNGGNVQIECKPVEIPYASEVKTNQKTPAAYVMKNDFNCSVVETNWNGIGNAIISSQSIEIEQPETKYAVELGFSGLRVEFVEHHSEDGRYTLSLATPSLPSQNAPSDTVKNLSSQNNKMSLVAPNGGNIQLKCNAVEIPYASETQRDQNRVSRHQVDDNNEDLHGAASDDKTGVSAL